MGVNEAAIRTNATGPISKIHIEENLPEMKKIPLVSKVLLWTL